MDAIYFPSGSNHQGEIEGFAALGMPVGVAAPEVSEGAIVALERLAGSRSIVFVDSGAFSEVAFGPTGPQIVEEITAEEWDRRLGLYERLGRALGRQLFAVAPDCVGFQAKTLERLATYADRVRALRAIGVNVIVPIQKGELSMAAFDERACEILGFADYVRGIPSKKDATTTADIVAFLTARPQAERVHLLGLGAESERYPEVIAAIEAVRPDLDLYCDSVLIRRFVGKTNGAGGGPRKYTATIDGVWADELAARAFEDVDHDWTDLISDIAFWSTAADRKLLVERLRITGDEAALFKRDPNAWFQEDDRYLMDFVAYEVDRVWQEGYFFRASVVERKREAVLRCFAGMAPAQVEQASLFAA